MTSYSLFQIAVVCSLSFMITVFTVFVLLLTAHFIKAWCEVMKYRRNHARWIQNRIEGD